MGYISKVLLTAAALMLTAAVTNYAADPYGIFAAATGEPHNSDLYDSHLRLAKAHAVASARPQGVILGSSRAEMGLSPAHPVWDYEPVYNLALPQTNVRELREYLEHAIAVGELREVVLALDFYMFNPALPARPDFKTCRLRDAGSSWSALRATLCDVPSLLLSRTAFVASLRQAFGETESAYLRDGSRHAQAGEAPIQRAGSQHRAFLASEARYAADMELLRGFVVGTDAFEQEADRHFEALLTLAHEHEIDLRMLISPSHARQWEVIDRMRLWDAFVEWKRYLLETTHAVAAEHSARPFPIWDFADYNEYSQEPLPPIDDADARMTWYWESSHYTRALGDLVLEQVLAGKSHGLGSKLEPKSFDAWIEEIERRRAAYRAEAEAELPPIISHADELD